MYQDRYKVYGSPRKKQYLDNYRESNKEIVSKLSVSPKKKHISPQFTRKSYLDEEIYQDNNYPQRKQVQHNLNCEKDSKLSGLIYEAISSADRVMKQILNFELPQLEGLCSKYFLNKQKLYSYLHSQSAAFPTYKSKNSKLSKFKPRKEENYQEEKEQISLYQLQKLENIVYNKIIPLLKQDIQRQRKKQRHSKLKMHIEIDNPEQREGMYLLQKLNSKGKRFNLDEYSEVLEKYIFKVMNRQSDLLSRTSELEQKLEEETNKIHTFQNLIKKREEEKLQNDIQRANQLKRLVKYQDFVKKIQSLLKEQQDYFTKETQNLDSLTSKIRRLLKEESNNTQKKGIHRQQSLRQHTESQHSRSSKQILQKEVMRNLNKEIGDFKQFCEQLQEKLKQNNEEIIKAQNKERKLMRENQSLCKTIEKLTEDLSQANKMVEDYLGIVSRVDQEIKLNQQNFNRLKQELQRQEQQKKNMQEKNEQLLKHLQELEYRYKYLEELVEKKEQQYEEILQNLDSKQTEIKQLVFNLQQYQKETKRHIAVLAERQEIIKLLEYKLKTVQSQFFQIMKQSNNHPIHENHENDNFVSKNPQNSEKLQTEGNNPIQSQPQAVVVDDVFINRSEPNHQRQDFIPIHRFKDQEENKLTEKNHINTKQLDPKLLSQLSSQKEIDKIEKNNPLLELSNENLKRQQGQLIKIQDDKQVQGSLEQFNSNQGQRKLQIIENGLIELQSSCSLIKKFEQSVNGPTPQKQKIGPSRSNQKILKQEMGIQTSNLLLAQNFVQSQVVFRFIPEIKRILSKEEPNQTINQSLIDQLEMFNTGKFIQSMKLQRGQAAPLQQNKQLQAKLNQLVSFNQELKRQVAFLKAQKGKVQAQRSEYIQEVANCNQLTDQLENLEVQKSQPQINQQHPEKMPSEVGQQPLQKGQHTQGQPIEQQKAEEQEFSWKDLVPQYFNEKCSKH